MWLFLIFALPLALAHAIASWYPATELESTNRTLLRGLVAAIPLWFLSRFIGSLAPSLPGSPLFAVHEWFDRFLPYSLLPLGAYAFFWRLDDMIEADRLQRRMTAFFGACLAPIGFGEMTRNELSPSLYSIVLLPIILIAIVAIMPAVFRAWTGAWTSRRVLIAAGFVGTGLIVSLVRWLLLARFWYLSVLIVAATAMAAWIWALPGLFQRPTRKMPLT
ncbi:MAG TPA: hypothetical protein VMV44_01700 [Rectinemataceae bacterium]|nr:hypothetical protein [Rectinemataceae bacterium]